MNLNTGNLIHVLFTTIHKYDDMYIMGYGNDEVTDEMMTMTMSTNQYRLMYRVRAYVVRNIII